jgi:NADH-quinone oxidoreductase subunit M
MTNILLFLPLTAIIMNLLLKVSDTTLLIINLVISITAFIYSLFFIWGFQIKNTAVVGGIVFNPLGLVGPFSVTTPIFFGVYGISIVFVILTTVLFPLCFLASWNILKDLKYLLTCLQILELLILMVFLTRDIFLFYVFF